MIEEIKKLRSMGLSFRKIADELHTTVGKVQYQWKKYQKREETLSAAKRKPIRIVRKGTIQARYLNKGRLNTKEKEHLTAWILSENKLFIFWRLSEIKKDLVLAYFDQSVSSFQKVLRLYDVTETPFISNETPILEVKLEEGQAVSFLKQPQDNRCYLVEIGILVSGHRFFPLLRSNQVHIPKGSAKQETEENEVYSKRERTPQWVEHVSTYSYYERISKEDDRS
ncbi:DUF4912 domain-containing protein [Bacillus tuaregi]|uniref:DUF4912 domain-containing protein n=1 Tax=Bacillus tuaregi TaxID=1816695 RepID=UPI0008F8B2AE|nr:DUF4912 domain-containing protein [Bacillus tuaregi]